MNFELKNVEKVGAPVIGETVKTQYINITAGVVGCPYNMVITKTVDYEFTTDSIEEAIAGIPIFAAEWVVINYPNI